MDRAAATASPLQCQSCASREARVPSARSAGSASGPDSPARLEQQDRAIGVFRETGRECGAGRTGSDDNDVVGGGHAALPGSWWADSTWQRLSRLRSRAGANVVRLDTVNIEATIAKDRVTRIVRPTPINLRFTCQPYTSLHIRQRLVLLPTQGDLSMATGYWERLNARRASADDSSAPLAPQAPASRPRARGLRR